MRFSSRRLRFLLGTFIVITQLVIAVPADAGLIDDLVAQQEAVRTAADVGTGSHPGAIVAKIVNGALGILGALFVGLMVYAGYLWMTAGGESEPVDKAKDTMRRAVIGLVIVLAAYAIAKFITVAIVKGTSG